MNQNILTISLIIVSVALTISILLQNKGAGISEIFGGSNNYNYRTKRGLEKIISRSTVVLAALLVIICITNLII